MNPLAAKQEAFEESIKLKNQFRNLDEDEVEFLDSVLESTRKKEEDVKRETTEQLDLFRRQQEDADKVLLEEGRDADDTKAEAGSPEAGEGQWAVNARKRKRVKEKEGLKGVKIRKSSSANETSVNPSEDTRKSEIGKEGSFSVATVEEQEAEKISSNPKSQLVAGKAAVANAKTGNPAPSATTGLGLAGYSSDEG